METRKILIGLAAMHRGDWNKIYQSVSSKKDLPTEGYVDNFLSKCNCGIITILDENYPSYLKNITMPPFVLFYYGDISLIYSPENNLAVIGTREPTEHGINATKNIIGGLNKNIVIVSGMAGGIDGLAHQTAMNWGLATIAVLGSGINLYWPPENKDLYYEIKRGKKNLIISEYPPNTPPYGEQFPMRNRLISGLSKCVLVTEAKRKSGTSVTMAFALAQGRDVLCVPSSDLNNSACNLCIRDGAFLVENSEDVNAFYRKQKLLW